jgi:ATP-dependent protease ClpP protease subunit
MKWIQTHQSSSGLRADVFLFDTIDDWFGIGKTALVDGISQSGASDLLLHISSPGGSVDDALAMHDYLRDFHGNVTARITGFALSAATIVALGAHTVEMSENALFMIHRISATSQDAHAAELRHTAGVIESLEEQLIHIYHRKCQSNGKETSAEQIRKMMEEETWMTAQEALNRGFIDRIHRPGNVQDQPQNNMKDVFNELKQFISAFRHKPLYSSNKPEEPENKSTSLKVSLLEQKSAALTIENEALKARLTRLEARGIEQPAGRDPEPGLLKPQNPVWEAEARALLNEMSPIELSMLKR